MRSPKCKVGVVGDGLKLHWVTTVYELRTEVLMQWADCNDEQRLRPDDTNLNVISRSRHPDSDSRDVQSCALALVSSLS